MKRIIASIALIAIAFGAGAQDLNTAVTAGDNNYYGTARSIALGNAMTALGGDLGSIGINPAGGAVNNYSQFTISPGLTLSSTMAQYAPTFDSSVGLRDSDYGSGLTDRRTRFVLPNIGFNLYYETGRQSGLKGFSFGFVSNTTGSYGECMTAVGTNNETSMLGALAVNAGGYQYTDLANGYGDLNSIVAYQSGMISTYGNATDSYWGATETEFLNQDGSVTVALAGPVNQRSSIASYGYKSDMVFNAALNYNDKYYIGGNIGMPVSRYRYNEAFREVAADTDDFPLDNTNFDYAEYGYAYSREMTGIYAKIGVIAKPVKGLRLGFAAQTPTIMTVKEDYATYGDTFYTNGAHDSADASSYFDYVVRTPYILDFGVAYTFNRGLVSLDYELTDYSVSRFSTLSTGANYDFTKLNRLSKLFLGVSNSFRAGVEYKVNPAFALRAGAGMVQAAQFYYTDENGYAVTAEDYDANFNWYENHSSIYGKKRMDGVRYNVSCGLGYSSAGSFFADFAARMTSYPVRTFMPYSDYLYDNFGNLLTPSPTVKMTRKMVDLVFTFGWRF